MNLRTILAKAIHKADFWSVRSPIGDQPSLREPDYVLRAMPREEARRELAMVVPTSNGISSFKNSFFAWRRDTRDQFTVASKDARLRELVTTGFLRRPYGSHPLYGWGGGLNDLDDLLRSVAEELMIDGRVWVAAFWRAHKEGRQRLILPQFRILRHADIQWTGQRPTLRLRRSWPGNDFEEVQVDAGDLVQFDWPLPGISHGGISPVDRAFPLHLKQNRLMDESVEAFRVQAETDDHRFRSERARWMDSGRMMSDLSNTGIEISAELYEIVSNKPMTKYFDGYQVLQLYRRHAVVREALLSTFNDFTARFSSLVRPRAKPATLELLDYPSAALAEDVIDRYTAKELDIEAAVALVRPKDRRGE